ncbi:MAG: hypothetical protein K8S97_13035 [Anaerolineae bacterium]|nr:hypothetical protein [Anaerolineae bacterium]
MRHIFTGVPVRFEVLNQVCGFNQFVIVNGAHCIQFPLQLLALFNVFFLQDEPLVPPKIDALNDVANFCHAFNRSGILYSGLYCRFYTLPESIRNCQMGEDGHDLCVYICNVNVTLTASLITPLTRQTTIVCFFVCGVPEGTHLAVVFINQPVRFVSDAFSAIHPVV